MGFNSYGPSSHEQPSFFDAPRLVSGDDRRSWRRDVLEWVNFTKLRAASGEKTANANKLTMAYMLYRALHQDYKAVLDNARDHGDLVFDGDAEHQEKAVKTIIALIGEDTPVDVTNRILAAYRKLHACVRRGDETPSKFADRFRGLASEYMTLSGISVNGKESQLIAMVLLQNSRLDVNTSNAITIQLVAKADSRKDMATRISDIITARRDEMASLKTTLDTMKHRLAQQMNNADEAATSITMQDAKDFEMDINNLMETVCGFLDAETTEAASNRNAPEILLDDVHKALSNLQTNTGQISNGVKSDIDNLTKKVNQFASLLGKRNSEVQDKPDDKNSDDSNKPAARKTKFAKLKAKTKCHDCGEIGHWKGDTECKMRRDSENNTSTAIGMEDGNTAEQHFPRRGQ